MNINSTITKTNDFPIKHEGNIHDGKVRSVYWLNKKDSFRIGEPFEVIDSQLGVMLISDRISAFECIWQGEILKGVPGKGASLNAISQYWFKRFEEEDLADNHLLATPHPLVWIVQRAEPVMVEAIARQYITGSMWRAYEKNKRIFCGNELPEGLERNQKLNELLITPTTKGILKGISGVPEEDDVDITRDQIVDNYELFGFKFVTDIARYENLLREGFRLVSNELQRKGLIHVDEKKEFGYIKNNKGELELIYIDEPPTPDSSRMWDAEAYERGEVLEKSKELFREILLKGVPDRDILLNKNRMLERVELVKSYRVADKDMIRVSELYNGLAKKITGEEVPIIENAREEIIDCLVPYEIIK